MFSLCLRQYVYSSEQSTFVVVPAMPSHLPLQVGKALRALQLIGKGIQCFLVVVTLDIVTLSMQQR